MKKYSYFIRNYGGYDDVKVSGETIFESDINLGSIATGIRINGYVIADNGTLYPWHSIDKIYELRIWEVKD